jgi:hypothetical protein
MALKANAGQVAEQIERIRVEPVEGQYGGGGQSVY